jgi:carboxyl-terminal processing protease
MPKAIKYLISMKRLPLLLLMLSAGIFLTFRTLGTTGKAEPPTKYERILQSVGEMLKQGHYSPKDINDNFSKIVFKKFLEELDPEKNILMQEDFVALKRHETRVDDEIKGAPVEFFTDAAKIFNKRIEEVAKEYKDILSKPFDFTVDENYITDPKKVDFATGESQRREMWRKRLKYMVLDRYVELQDIQEKNKGKAGFTAKSNTELEKEAREKVVKIMDRTFDRYRFKFNDVD